MIEAEWCYLRQTNSPHVIFICYASYFQLNLDEISFLCNEGELRIIGGNDKPRQLQCFEVFGYSPPVWGCSGCEWSSDISIKREKFYQRILDNNFVIKYGFPEGSCVIPKKAACMDDETLEKAVKLVALSIRKMAVRNVAFGCYTLSSNYRTLHLCPS